MLGDLTPNIHCDHGQHARYQWATRACGVILGVVYFVPCLASKLFNVSKFLLVC